MLSARVIFLAVGVGNAPAPISTAPQENLGQDSNNFLQDFATINIGLEAHGFAHFFSFFFKFV